MAYAAVLSLMETLKQILDADNQHLLDHKKQQFESLLGKACSLQDFLEDSWQTSGEDGGLSLASEVHAPKFDICLLAGSGSRKSSSTQAARVADTMVGFDDDLMQLKDRLTGQQSKLQIIPIVGMGGIVSQEYCLREILLCLLDCTTKGFTNDMRKESDEELCMRLYKSLKGRRYLIVIDDIWTTKAWDDIKMLFPDDNSGSRIMLTTRLSNLAAYVDSCSPHHQMRFLNDDESWKLLQETACLEENYLELEKFGKEIAKNCRGLPLTIAVIGGVLSKLDKRQDVWEHVAKNVTANTSLNITNGGRRRIIYENSGNGHDASAGLIKANNETLKSTSAVRSFVCIGRFDTTSPVYFGYRMLRVLDVAQIHFYSFPEELVELFNLRYLAYTSTGKLPSSISMLQNLQTLIVHQVTFAFLFKLPPEIWEMPQLRHICFTECALSDLPCGQIGGGASFSPGRLETLSVVRDFMFTKENCRRVENVKKLGIKYDYASTRGQWECYSLNNLDQLHKLEILKCLFGGHDYLMFLPSSRNIARPTLTFPPNLKKLILSGCLLPWEDMTHIGSLPKLEVLKLHRNAFCGKVWEPIEGEFLRLKYLKLHHLDLTEWRADETHFPSLQHLILKICSLKEIPSGIGEIPTLELIQVDDCYISTVTSAIHLKEEQQSLGNDGLKLCINYSTVTESTKKLIRRA
ncbi:UNVERIFIED_CONTAM: Disease resistance protein RPP13 [Sesamum latifolium]|uniref:Disease resistance protein RPP13 n=1 Tax=Sesamum latifolium TaxID=2727402 RepID=A0AAW2YEQ5_9LAMI